MTKAGKKLIEGLHEAINMVTLMKENERLQYELNEAQDQIKMMRDILDDIEALSHLALMDKDHDEKD